MHAHVLVCPECGYPNDPWRGTCLLCSLPLPFSEQSAEEAAMHLVTETPSGDE